MFALSVSKRLTMIKNRIYYRVENSFYFNSINQSSSLYVPVHYTY